MARKNLKRNLETINPVDINTKINEARLQLDLLKMRSDLSGRLRIRALANTGPGVEYFLDGREKEIKNLGNVWFETGLADVPRDELLNCEVEILVKLPLKIIMALHSGGDNLSQQIVDRLGISKTGPMDPSFLMRLEAMIARDIFNSNPDS